MLINTCKISCINKIGENMTKLIFKISIILLVFGVWLGSIYGYFQFSEVSEQDDWQIMTLCDKEHGVYVKDYYNCLRDENLKLLNKQEPLANIFQSIFYVIPTFLVCLYLIKKLKYFK